MIIIQSLFEVRYTHINHNHHNHINHNSNRRRLSSAGLSAGSSMLPVVQQLRFGVTGRISHSGGSTPRWDTAELCHFHFDNC